MNRPHGVRQLAGMELLETGCVLAAHAGGEFGGLLIALNDSAMDCLLVGQRAGADAGQCEQQKPHSTSRARISRTLRAKSSTARASATRSSTERMMVGAASTWMPSERT